MQVEQRPTASLKPYPGNPRKNAQAVAPVVASIREFGFRVPILVDGDGVIIAGHTRLLAAQELGMDTVPVIVAADLTPEQVSAFRVADNKTNDFATWDDAALQAILRDLPADLLAATGFPPLVAPSPEDLAKEIAEEEEYQPVRDHAERAGYLVSEKLASLAALHPEKMANAAVVVVPTGKGRDCLILADADLPDIVAELRRRHEAGDEHPLSSLWAALVEL